VSKRWQNNGVSWAEAKLCVRTTEFATKKISEKWFGCDPDQVQIPSRPLQNQNSLTSPFSL
jgi:hypothetical protein